MNNFIFISMETTNINSIIKKNINYILELFNLKNSLDWINYSILDPEENKNDIDKLILFLNGKIESTLVDGWTLNKRNKNMDLVNSKFDKNGNLFIIDGSESLVFVFKKENYDKNFLKKLVLLLNI